MLDDLAAVARLVAGDLLQLDYLTAPGPAGPSVRAHFHDGLELGRKEGTAFVLYDEFDVEEGRGFTHSLLCTGGLELEIRFLHLRARLLPGVTWPSKQAGGAAWQLAEA